MMTGSALGSPETPDVHQGCIVVHAASMLDSGKRRRWAQRSPGSHDLDIVLLEPFMAPYRGCTTGPQAFLFYLLFHHDFML